MAKVNLKLEDVAILRPFACSNLLVLFAILDLLERRGEEELATRNIDSDIYLEAFIYNMYLFASRNGHCSILFNHCIPDWRSSGEGFKEANMKNISNGDRGVHGAIVATLTWHSLERKSHHGSSIFLITSLGFSQPDCGPHYSNWEVSHLPNPPVLLISD